MATLTRIGIIGDFNPENPTHVATNAGIQHAADALRKPISSLWLPTNVSHAFEEFQGFLASPGSPYKSMDGALAAIRYARENDMPFIGTCGGFQHLVIEFARNVMGYQDATHAESDPDAACLFVTPLSCSLVGKTMEVTLKAGSKAAEACQATRSMERFYCNFGLNPQYQEQLGTYGLNVTGQDQNGEVRIVELARLRFFLGTLFVPQASSTKGNPHPLILEFCRLAAR